jgi:hypothetical protein
MFYFAKNTPYVLRFKISMLFLFLSLAALHAQYHEEVFPGESGSGLIGKLRLEFRPGQVLSYGEARTEMYTKIYNLGDSVECVYSGYALPLSPDDFDPIGTLSRNGSSNGINCEHTFPQSKGAGSGNPRSDMHHLYPARARVNEARLNFPFDEVDDRTTQTWFVEDREQDNTPRDNIDAFSELGFNSFEPREVHKGNVARAIFYFYTIYREVADSDFFGEQRKVLCEWHYNDPVDSLEWLRNIMIAEYQDNKRNPFVLDCSLAARTYCPDVAERCAFTSTNNPFNLNFEVSPNPAFDHLTINTSLVDRDMSFEVINSMGQKLRAITETAGDHFRINISHLPAGIYTLSVSGNQKATWLGSTTFVKLD